MLSKSKELYEILSSEKNIVLVGHTNPDGDCVGSLMGLYNYVKKNNIQSNISIIVPNEFPYFLKFLDSKNFIVVYEGSQNKADVLIDNADYIFCMDFNSFIRIDKLGEKIEASCAEKVLIDHHPLPDISQFKIVFSKPEMSSTCEVVYSIIKEFNEDGVSWDIPKNAAISLYTGLVTDTNNFANSVLPSSFLMAGELLLLGVDKELIQSKIYGGFSEERMRLMGYMLNSKMKIFHEKRAALMIIDDDIKSEFNFKEGDSEGFVNLALGIKNIDISALFTQADGFIKVSLRSKGSFSVNRLARKFFNGGGHERAAGGRLYIPLSEVEDYFIMALNNFQA